MMRVRLKADGRLVEILADGSERPLPPGVADEKRKVEAPSLAPLSPGERDLAGYARRIRANVRLTQAEFASRIGVFPGARDPDCRDEGGRLRPRPRRPSVAETGRSAGPKDSSSVRSGERDTT